MNETIQSSLNTYREKVDRKLIIRQRLFLVIISVLLIIGIVNVYEKKITSVLAISGLLLSTAIGFSLSRMFKIFWHQEKGKVISQLDTVGVIFLILYILVEVGRTWLFKHWLSGPALSAFGLIILTGLLLGRFLGTIRQIKTVLEENKDAVQNTL